MSEQLHEQFLRKSRSSFINNEENFKDLASDLSVRFRETLKPLLNSNHLRPSGQNSVVWRNGIERVFIKLEAQTALWSRNHKFPDLTLRW